MQILLRRSVIEIKVWRYLDRVYKQLPKYNADNAIYFLTAMQDTGYVPKDVRREELEVISMEYIQEDSITAIDPAILWSHYNPLLDALKDKGIRHGDLTTYSILVRDSRPYLIDFAESRIWDSPIPDKRPEGDSYWLKKSFSELTRGWGIPNNI